MTTKRSDDVTVGELGGEIWAELCIHVPESKVDAEAKGDVVQLVIGVLARYVGSRIGNDEDFRPPLYRGCGRSEGLRPRGRAGKRSCPQIR